MKTQNWTREKAYTQAALEWDQHKTLGTITEQKTPKIVCNDQKNKILIDILKTASQTGKPITRNLEGCAIDQYTAEEWRELCTKIMTKIREITTYLGIENKFIMKFMGTTPYIQYQK